MTSKDDMIGFAREALGISEPASVELSFLEGRGSDRTFFRLKWSRKETAILIHYDPRRLENAYYADIGAFLHDIDVPVPQMIHHDPGRCLIAIEDLGDTDLWSLREIPWESRKALYEKTLIVAHRLHSFPEKDFPSGRVKLMEDFTLDLYRWERNYFRDHFVRDFCGLKLEPAFERELEEELSSMAERLARTRRCLVHRDLQSRNVMIRDGEPFLIDFQGMRFGSPFYDLGSLLCDPYVGLLSGEREELSLFYFMLTKWNLDWSTFQNIFWEASTQRLMQCLGAYAFLGLKKGLKAYIKHIPAGLNNLQLAAGKVASLHRLRELSAECNRIIDQRD
jgi:hypothetical protein